MDWSRMFSKFSEMPWYTWAAVVAIALCAVLLFITGKRTKWNSKRIAYAAMCIAISFVLSLIRIYRMPQGGSVTLLSMFPLIMFAVACGPMRGFLMCFAYGLLQLLQGADIIHPMQMLLDYPIAYGALAMGGLVKYLPIKDPYRLPSAMLIGAFFRFIIAVLSGVVFFSSYAIELGQVPVLYSAVYNIGYIGVEALLCAALAFVPNIKRLETIFQGN